MLCIFLRGADAFILFTFHANALTHTHTHVHTHAVESSLFFCSGSAAPVVVVTAPLPVPQRHRGTHTLTYADPFLRANRRAVRLLFIFICHFTLHYLIPIRFRFVKKNITQSHTHITDNTYEQMRRHLHIHMYAFD